MRRVQQWVNFAAVAAVLLAFGLIVTKNMPGRAGDRLLNVSYDPTRELYSDLNGLFLANYAKETGRPLKIIQSHGGSSRQSRKVIDGEEAADVVTLGLFSDVDALRKRGLIAENWAGRLPNHSQPYTSTIVFVVREGNPKGIKDWPDLLQAGVEIITPSPKTSGNGKLNALAAWGAILSRGGGEADARAYLKDFYRHVPVLDEGARGAATTFATQEIGDVHLTWENEALREVAESKGKLRIVYPPVSILAEPYVAWVDANVARNGTADIARAYLEFLFTDEAQKVMLRLGYRPYKQDILQGVSATMSQITLIPITAIAHDWDDAQQKFFAENGIIDSVMRRDPS